MGFFGKLFGSDQAGKSFDGKEIGQTRFEKHDLTGATFRKANVSQCDFNGANLTNADLSGAVLTQCHFEHANLTAARLVGADLTQCDFRGATMDGVVATGAHFSQCHDVPPALYSRYDDLDDDDAKLGLVRARLQGLVAVSPGGAVKERRDDDKVYFGGTHAARPYRFVVDTTWGSVVFELKASSARGSLRVAFDPDAVAKPAQAGDPDWDAADGTPARQEFLTPGLYLEDSPHEVARMKAMLAGPLLDVLATLLPAVNAKRLDVDGDRLELVLRDDVLHPELAARARKILDGTDAIAKLLAS